MKKILTHIFVVLANFYILTYGIGLSLMIITMFIGPLNPKTVMLLVVGIFSLCVIYQFTRHKYRFQSFGETLIDNSDKNQILNQTKSFSITRIPVFILMLITLAISGNILDGLSEQQVYTLGYIFPFSLLAVCIYYGMKYFIISNESFPIFLLISGLMLIGFLYKLSPNAQMTGNFMFNIYLGLSVLWLIIGLIYKAKRIKITNA